MKPKLYKTLHKNGKDIVSEYNNKCKWQIGKWKKTTKKLEMCKWGFHASEKIRDAMYYVAPGIITEVEVRGKCQKQDDKQVWSEMRIVK
jgi:hypothetical protein